MPKYKKEWNTHNKIGYILLFFPVLPGYILLKQHFKSMVLIFNICGFSLFSFTQSEGKWDRFFYSHSIPLPTGISIFTARDPQSTKLSTQYFSSGSHKIIVTTNSSFSILHILPNDTLFHNGFRISLSSALTHFRIFTLFPITSSIFII